jgi:hypothetical protein
LNRGIQLKEEKMYLQGIRHLGPNRYRHEPVKVHREGCECRWLEVKAVSLGGDEASRLAMLFLLDFTWAGAIL